MKVKVVSQILQAILWIATLFFAFIWVMGIEIPFEPEPITVILILVSSAVSTLANMYEKVVKKEEFSTANALAYGYVNNFIEPSLTQLIRDLALKQEQPMLNVFIPESLSDLSGKSIERLKVALIEKGIQNKDVKVKLDEGRGLRDVMTLSSVNLKNVYLDFPNTLTTLNSIIDYKVKSPKDSLCKKAKDELGTEYIQTFKTTLIEMLTEKGLYPKYVKFVDKDLKV